MSMQEIEEFNVVGLQRSPVKRTPRGCPPAGAGENLSGATTARMSMASNLSAAESLRSVGSSSSSAATSGNRRHHALQPMATNSVFDNSVYSSGGGGGARTPSPSPSTLDKMSSAISSKKEALAARRSALPVSRTLRLSPAADTAHLQESATDEARAAATTATMLYSDAGDHTHRSMTRSALFSALGRLPSTPDCATPTSNQGENATPPPSSSDNHQSGLERGSPQLSAVHHQEDQPSTPAVALGETGFLDGGNISNIDDGRSRVWSDCSFTNAVFSPDAATPAVARNCDRIDRSGGGGGGSTRGATDQATGVAQAPRVKSNSSRVGEIASCNSANTTNSHAPAATPAAVAALLRMGGNSTESDLTPGSGIAASRYRGYVAHSPIAVSARKECDAAREGIEVPSTPAAAATLAAMMMGSKDTVAVEGKHDRGSGEEEVESMKGEEDNRVTALPNSQVCYWSTSMHSVLWAFV